MAGASDFTHDIDVLLRLTQLQGEEIKQLISALSTERSVRAMAIEQCAQELIKRWPWTEDHMKDRDCLVAHLRALGDIS